MRVQCLDGESRNQSGVRALIASVVIAMLLAVGCGQSVPADEPTHSSGGGAQLAP